MQEIVEQNAEHSNLTVAQIEAMDQDWRGQVGSSDSTMISSVVQGPSADFLRGLIANSNGVAVEAFVTDNRGLNVASALILGDYWQGDEAKFQETFPKGADAVHIGEVEFDETTQLYLAQISFTVTDADGAPIGMMTLSIDPEALG